MNLLANIPRLEPVIEILSALTWSDARIAELGDGTIATGARILALVLEYDNLVTQGHSMDVAVQTLRQRPLRYGAQLIEQFATHLGAGAGGDMLRDMPLRSVLPGMIIMQDVRTHMGTLLVARGFRGFRDLPRADPYFGPRSDARVCEGDGAGGEAAGRLSSPARWGARVK